MHILVPYCNLSTSSVYVMSCDCHIVSLSDVPSLLLRDVYSWCGVTRLMQFYLQPANRICEKKAILSVFPTGYSLYMLKTTVDPPRGTPWQPNSREFRLICSRSRRRLVP